MNLQLVGYDAKNNAVNLPKILAYEMHIGMRGSDIWFEFKFFENISHKLIKVDIYKENRKKYSCFIDKIEKISSNQGDYFLLKVRCFICRIWQNQVQPIEYKNYYILNMIDKYCKPYGIFKTKFPSNVSLKTFYVELGMTAWDVLSVYCYKAFNLFSFINEDFEICGCYSPKKDIIFDSQHFKYIKLIQREDRSNVISKIHIKFNNGISNFSEYYDNVFAQKVGILREKYYQPPKQWSILPKRGASYLVDSNEMKRNTYEITVAEHVDIHPGMKARVDGQECYTYEVHFSLNEKGPITQIKLFNNSF